MNNPLQEEYNKLCAQYGHAKIQLRFWKDQIHKMNIQINALGEIQKEIEERKMHDPNDKSTQPENQNDG